MNFSKEVKISNFKINHQSKPFLVAEISANHNGRLQNAKDLMSAAMDSGADAVKLQTYTPDTMTLDIDSNDFKISGGLWDGYKLYDLYKEAHTPFEWHEELFEHGQNIGLIVFSTPFDETAVDLLDSLNSPAIKIASFEMTDIPLVEYSTKCGVPIVISTGLASENEIYETLKSLSKRNFNDVVLLHCVSGYPTPYDQYNLSTINLLREKFNILVGISDHTLGTEVAVSSVALGAKLIEKHFIMNRSDGGPDSSFSLEPKEFYKLSTEVENAWKAIGIPSFKQKKVEKENLKFRRSIYSCCKIKKGEVFTSENIKRIRPGFGLEPKFYHEIIGKKSICNIDAGTPIKKNHFE